MNIKAVLLGALAYTLVTFPLAVTWHVILFKSIYIELGYFDGEPSFLLGIITIILQGSVLSFLYPYVTFSGSRVMRGLKYALLLGIFFWTSHVLAFVAKQDVSSPLVFLVMETFYLFLQFGLYGLLIGLIYTRYGRERT